MTAPKTQKPAPTTREVLVPDEETERPERVTDRDDPDDRQRASEGARWRDPRGGLGWQGPDE